MQAAIRLRFIAIEVALIACGHTPHAQDRSVLSHEIAELWQDPVDLLDRDLFHGPGGSALAPPSTDGTFEFLAFKKTGTNPGYDVKDASGRVWSVKLGIEAQPEVTTSRILWAIGYHQPATFLVEQWSLSPEAPVMAGLARFRREQPTHKVVDEWSWYENPFVATQALT